MFVVVFCDHCNCGKSSCLADCVRGVYGPFAEKADAEVMQSRNQRQLNFGSGGHWTVAELRASDESTARDNE